MKKNGLQKIAVSALWIAALLALSAVTAFADVAPSPTELLLSPVGIVLAVAIVIIAVSVLIRKILNKRKDKDDK